MTSVCRTILCAACRRSGRAEFNHEMRISFGNASEEEIREGIRRLGKVLKKFI